jgi:hypothetical protein
MVRVYQAHPAGLNVTTRSISQFIKVKVRAKLLWHHATFRQPCDLDRSANGHGSDPGDPLVHRFRRNAQRTGKYRLIPEHGAGGDHGDVSHRFPGFAGQGAALNSRIAAVVRDGVVHVWISVKALKAHDSRRGVSGSAITFSAAEDRYTQTQTQTQSTSSKNNFSLILNHLTRLEPFFSALSEILTKFLLAKA